MNTTFPDQVLIFAGRRTAVATILVNRKKACLRLRLRVPIAMLSSFAQRRQGGAITSTKAKSAKKEIWRNQYAGRNVHIFQGEYGILVGIK